MQPLTLGWYSTGNGEGSYRLLEGVLEAIKAEKLNAQMQFVVCTRELGEAAGSDNFIQLAKSHQIPVVAVSWSKFKAQNPNSPPQSVRADYEQQIINQTRAYAVDWAVMAGYMLISQSLHTQHKTLNLHPALPNGPVGTWKQVVRELIETDATRSGITIHLVDERLDAGKTIAYCEYDLRTTKLAPLWQAKATAPQPLADALRAEILHRESTFLTKTLQALTKNPHLSNHKLDL